MKSSSDKIKEKVLIESLINKDFDSFKLILGDVIDDQYASIVSTRVNQQMGLNNV